jgi:shikimate dehydrogenase
MSRAYHLGLLGYPLEHSFSPRLHAAALSRLGLDGEYRLYPIPPGDAGALAAILAGLRGGELDGLNVTIPHKQAIIPFLDELTPLARAVGAVNTIYVREGRLIGDNTDAPGFLADLERSLGPAVAAPSQALVLGAGGAARAVAYALRQAGWEVTIAARRIEQAEALAAALPAPITALALDAESLASLAPALIVNTTPLGMSPSLDTCAWPAGLPFPKAVAVYDLVYNPPETLIVRRARAAGLPAVTGMGMLIEQASLSFARWTGELFPNDMVYEAIYDPGGCQRILGTD